MSLHGIYNESTYRSNAGKPHNLAAFNMELIRENLGSEIIWAFDPSYIRKSGKKTAHVGKFWSGCAGAVKWGLEISSIAAVDIQQQTAMHYVAQQTPAGLKGDSVLKHYVELLTDRKEELQSISCIVVADAFFSKKPFVAPLLSEGFEVISRFRNDAKLRYIYAGPQRGGSGKSTGKGKGSGGGRPKQFDGVVNPKKGTIKSAKIYFSTNLSRIGIDILLYYRLRFQQEFLFRDASQHVGLHQCQSVKEEKIDFHVNMSLTTINLAKAMHYLPNKTEGQPFSMADIKTQYVNKLLLDETINIFISTFGICPNMIKNNPSIQQLYNKGKIAA